MALNLTPAVVEARDLLEKHGADIVIVLRVKLGYRMRCAGYGRTKAQCSIARKLADVLYGEAYEFLAK